MNAVVPAPLSAGDADARSHRVRRWLLMAAVLGGLWVIAALTQAGHAIADPVTPSAGLGTGAVTAIAPAAAKPVNTVNSATPVSRMSPVSPKAVIIPSPPRVAPAPATPPVPAPVQPVLTQAQPVLIQAQPVLAQTLVTPLAAPSATLTPPSALANEVAVPSMRSAAVAHLVSSRHAPYDSVAKHPFGMLLAALPVASSNDWARDRNLPTPNGSPPGNPIGNPAGNSEHSPNPAVRPTDLPRPPANTARSAADLNQAVPNISPKDLPFSPD